MNINTIYVSYMGEANYRGIGAPAIFVRTQGCHLRCYKTTIGTLCDTPEALEFKEKPMELQEIVKKVVEIKNKTGIDYVCLTGGEPLWRNTFELRNLLSLLTQEGIDVTVETSGTVDIRPFLGQGVHWVLDYKLKSAGVKMPFKKENLFYLNKQDIVKFVVYDEQDYQEMAEVVKELPTQGKFVAGVYWNGKMTTTKLFEKLVSDSLTKYIALNVQLHKMVTTVDGLSKDILGNIEIPQEI